MDLKWRKSGSLEENASKLSELIELTKVENALEALKTAEKNETTFTTKISQSLRSNQNFESLHLKLV